MHDINRKSRVLEQKESRQEELQQNEKVYTATELNGSGSRLWNVPKEQTAGTPT